MKKLAAIFAAAVMVFTIGTCVENRSNSMTEREQSLVQEV